MGYRFTLETANTIANLTFGKIISCYRDIYSSPQNYEGFLEFLAHADFVAQKVVNSTQHRKNKDNERNTVHAHFPFLTVCWDIIA